MSELCGYIDDGYYQDHTFPSDGVSYPDVKISFRPVVNSEARRLNFQISKLNENDESHLEKWNDLEAEVLERHILKWDLTDREGKPVPITRDTIKRICRPLYRVIFNLIVNGEHGEDRKN